MPRARGPKPSPLIKPFVVLALPGMYLFYKYNQFKRKRKENATRRLAERELLHLNNKIVGSMGLGTIKILPLISKQPLPLLKLKIILSIKNGKHMLPIKDNCLEEERSDDSIIIQEVTL